MVPKTNWNSTWPSSEMHIGKKETKTLNSLQKITSDKNERRITETNGCFAYTAACKLCNSIIFFRVNNLTLRCVTTAYRTAGQLEENESVQLNENFQAPLRAGIQRQQGKKKSS